MRACRLPTWGTRDRSACPYLPYRRLCYHRLGRSSSGGGWFSQTPCGSRLRPAEVSRGRSPPPWQATARRAPAVSQILGVGGARRPRRLDGPGAILANCEGSRANSAAVFPDREKSVHPRQGKGLSHIRFCVWIQQPATGRDVIVWLVYRGNIEYNTRCVSACVESAKL